MEVEYLEITKIKPYLRNAKKHSEEQVKRIAASIKEFGFAQPLVVDKDNVLVIGHGRLLASQVRLIRTDNLSFSDKVKDSVTPVTETMKRINRTKNTHKG